MAADDFHFGLPWAADGESRPSRLRTVLARVDGVGEGVLFVQDGPGPEGRYWTLVSEWLAWVQETKAKLFVSPDDDQPDEAA
jgi:hypothetical protein